MMAAGAVERIYALSPLQEGILFHARHSLNPEMYFEQFSFTLRGSIDVRVLRRAWEAVVERHAVLRTSFHWEEVTTPVQVVHRAVQLPFDHQDWSGAEPADQQERLRAFLRADRARGFDLSAAPLIRFALIALSKDVSEFVISFHHILLDGWSLSVLFKEASAVYLALLSGLEPRFDPVRPFEEYIAWLQGQDPAGAEAFWTEALRGYTGPSPLSIDRRPGTRSDPDDGCASCRVTVPAATTAALRDLARTNQLTLNTIVQGAWALLLSRYSDRHDVVFGATMSGRPAALPGIESMVGLFINTVPVRLHVDLDASLLPWLATVQRSVLKTREFEHSALVQVQGWSDVPRGTSLFETILGFENYPVDAARDGKAAATLTSVFERTNYPLSLIVWPATELQLTLMYACSRFDEASIARLLEHLHLLLDTFATNPDRRLREILAATELTDLPEMQRAGASRALTAAEERRLLVEWNDTRSAYPEQCVHDIFRAQVDRAPEAAAIAWGDARLTYRELHERAGALADTLRARGVSADVPVGVVLARSPELVIAQLAVLEAGGAYVPIDPDYPADRVALMLRDSGAAVVVTDSAYGSDLRRGSLDILCIDQVPAVPSTYAPSIAPAEPNPDSLAYVMYTSGSTGTPKGIAIPHRGIVRLVCGTNYISLGPSDRVAQAANACFDAATFEIWGALLNGACIVGVPTEAVLSAPDLAALIRDERITTLFLTTDLFHQLVRESPAMFRGVRTLLVGGSTMNPRRVRDMLTAGRPDRFLHVYGPTETTTFASWHEVDEIPADAVSVPIGRPVANTRLYVLDRDGSLAPIGAVGELAIGGDGLARGYLNADALTAEKFVPDPFVDVDGARLFKTGDLVKWRADGALEFLGRRDHQVKIRGFRVELGEIETALRRLPGVRECVVLAHDDAGDTKRLVAYVEVDPALSYEATDLRRDLKQWLPDYMVPSMCVVLDALPLTPNGKVDRGRLPDPAIVRSDVAAPFAAPSTPVEKVVAGIFRDVLRVERVGLDDSFFELGGHSLIATQIVSRISDTLQTNVPLRALFETPTVAGLVAHMLQDPEARARAERLAPVVLELAGLSEEELEARVRAGTPASGTLS